MITTERLEDISRFRDLLRSRIEEDPEPLSPLKLKVLVDMMGELIDHAQKTIQ